MTSPSFLNTGFAFTTLAAVVDVQTIMDAIQTMITSTLSSAPTNVFPSGERWTVVSPNVYKSAVDSAGRFMKITLARTSATRMGFKIEDPTGTLIDGEVQIAVAGSAVSVFGGPAHLWVEINNAATFETARAVITDPTPEPLAASSVYVWGATHRNTAGTVQPNVANGDFWGGRYYGGTVAGVGTIANLLARPRVPVQDTANTHLRTQAGSDVAAPLYIAVDSASSTNDFLNAGKLYQMVALDSNTVQGIDVQVPIDTGVTGTFRTVHMGGGIVIFGIRKG